MPMAGKGARAKLGGMIPVIPTPFDSDENVDEAALRRLVDFAVRCGVKAVCLPAYASEFYKLSEEERARVVRIAVGQAAGRVLVAAQSNHSSSRVARHASMLGPPQGRVHARPARRPLRQGTQRAGDGRSPPLFQ